jgi:hypothetical protein
MLVIKRQSKDGSDEFWDVKGERLYQRVVGGLAWPGERPGFAVVVGETASWRPPYHQYLITEIESPNVGELIRHCHELTKKCWVSAWYGRTDGEHTEILAYHNRQARARRERPLSLRSAPESDGGRLLYHVNLLLSRLDAANKSLYFNAESRLPGYLSELQSFADISKAKAEDFPAVAALGYAVAALTTYKFRGKDEIVTESHGFNPYDYL